ncbi:hypothetical protein BDQ12DRAFT_641983 [Crucibulum laeve]|uniref:F-box domain-containing protein n=1 Tax=Crucibulum laeve TaxID=68775 RepID=A0A5C3MJ67_9AGAR|nr:hypothetical protein BDQ12DRAFT_641983 [Crucibulum laeve]
MGLSDLPEDVLLYILQYCRLDDVARFSEVCVAFDAMSRRRGFWIAPLERTRRFNPIACPLHDDLKNFSLERLRDIAFHTLRLEKNWSLPKPIPIRPLQTTTFPNEKLHIIFRIPGTSLFLMHSPDRGTMTCWDATLGQPISKPLYVTTCVLEASLGRDEYGRFSRALLTVDEEVGLHSVTIVSVQYDKHPPEVEITFTWDCMPMDRFYFGIFLENEVVGVLRGDLSSNHNVEIIAHNTISDSISTIGTDLAYWVRSSLLFPDLFNVDTEIEVTFWKGAMLFQTENAYQHFLFSCPADLLPWNTNPRCPSDSYIYWSNVLPRSREVEIGMTVVTVKPEGILSSDQAYGLLGVSVLSPQNNTSELPSTLIRFWSPGLDNADKVDVSTIREDLVVVPGKLQQWSGWLPFKLAQSGKQLILIVTLDNETFLQLVRYYPETPATSVHRLDVPPVVDLKHLEGISIDDHLGVITLINPQGAMHTLAYA